MILKNTQTLNYLELSKLYFINNRENIKKKKYNLFFFSIFIHKKLHYYNFYYLNKLYNMSNGQLLQKRNKLIKFFKKSRKSFGASINILNKKLNKQLSSIFFFYCKNFNYKNYLWIKKFIYLIKPSVNYAIFTRGWSYVYKYKKRIKKKILRNLLKSTKQL